MARLVFFGMLVLGLFSCSGEPQNKAETLSDESRNYVESIRPLSDAEGLEMLKMHCYSCHNPKSSSHDDMLAPPLAGIRHKYKQLYEDRDEFVYKMSEFILHPSEENAVMRGPVKRFGLMPETTITTEEEVYQLVSYMYDHALEAPEWFPAHFEERHGESWDPNK